MTIRLFFLSVYFLMAASAHAQSLEGTWIAVLDVNGVVFPHVEELRIRNGGVSTAIYGVRNLPECIDKPPAQTGPCAAAQENITGQLAIDNDGKTVSVNNPKLSGIAMSGIGNADDERLARELFWFGLGEPWTFQRENVALVMRRQSKPVIPGTDLDGSKAIVIEKPFYEVDPEFAGDLIALAVGGEFSLAKTACIMPFIADSGAPAREFRALMRDVAAITRQRQALAAFTYANPSAEAVTTFKQIELTLGARDSLPSGQDITAAAMKLGVTAEQVERFIREIATRPRTASADALLLSPLTPYAADIRSCHKQYFE